MRVTLKVVQKGGEGKDIPITKPNFIIGRDAKCHLRPKSDLVSRRHCAVIIKESRVFIFDFDSKNGTFVNDEQVEKQRELKMGDRLRVGTLELDVQVDHGLGGVKRSQVKDVKEAAKRTGGGGFDDDDVSAWLEEENEAERAQRMADPETRQFKIDEAAAEQAAAEKAEAEAKNSKSAAKKKKKEPGKLPQRPEEISKDSKEAAEKGLKKIFRSPEGSS